MAMDDGHEKPTVLTGEQASQGYTVLRTPLRKAIFIGGLALFVVLVVFFSLYGRGH